MPPFTRDDKLHLTNEGRSRFNLAKNKSCVHHVPGHTGTACPSHDVIIRQARPESNESFGRFVNAVAQRLIAVEPALMSYTILHRNLIWIICTDMYRQLNWSWNYLKFDIMPTYVICCYLLTKRLRFKITRGLPQQRFRSTHSTSNHKITHSFPLI